MESNALRYPFTIRINIQITAPMKNSISHINGFLDTFKGDTKVIEPTTKMVTNNEAPTNSPIANPPLLALNEENVPKTSGAPLPFNYTIYKIMQINDYCHLKNNINK